MAKKRKSRRRKQSHSLIFFYIILAVLVALAIYSYKTNEEFRAQVDEIFSPILKPEDSSPTIIEDSEAEPAQSSKSGQSTSEKQKKPSKQKGFVALPENLEFPLCAGKHNAADHQIRNFAHYSVCYRESYEQAEWSAYCLTEDELVKNTNRSDDFRSDPEIVTGSATPADYKKSGYDRGHLSPAADFAFDEMAMSQTFYMSNMSPQTGGLNRGIWKDLEAEVRLWAKNFGRVYVVSGPILEKPASEYKSIGENHVAVPEFYYKVILAPLYADEKDKATPEDAESAVALGFIFPNEKCEGTLDDYAVTVDEVEKRTKLDFFSLLEDKVENEIERQIKR
ncbi:DNA/RNA non-specific endonuclease [uncultured Treponema sp.]|uniref:DNA/RNA non-specific endonuclease n=1 Tax=uncultured Treponema sp. TaxID=162155 RepID=UPI0025D9129A|nr:DNA/RNA non-specific endonuclease [uncultured Treponema sp.]